MKRGLLCAFLVPFGVAMSAPAAIAGEESPVTLLRTTHLPEDSLDTYTEPANIPHERRQDLLLLPETHQFFVIHPKTDVDTDPGFTG
jgi:hypothetical protein